ncbi:hypothetical protein ACYJ1Y_16675 [Natrialbaceae archaeon A-gly3]
MRRRKVLSGVVVGIGSLSGCFNTNDQQLHIDSDVEMKDILCDDNSAKAEIRQQSEDLTLVDGIIESITAEQKLTSTIYGPSEEQSIACLISAIDSEDSPVHCDGSVEYSCDIVHENVDVNEIKVLHETDEESKYINSLSIGN